MASKRINFLIASPPYNRIFAGVRVLHDLCHELNEIGHNAAIIFFHSGDGEKIPYQWSIANRPDLYAEGKRRHQLPLDNPQKTIAEYLKNGILIYPEIIKGNPLGGKNVVRYLLVKDENKYPGEFICSYSHTYRRDYHHVLFKITTPDCMNTEDTLHWSQRKMDATYFGKGPKYVECNLIPGTVLIERDWPRDQNQLAIMLKNTRYLFSYDGCTALTTDAMMCGAVPVILHDKQMNLDDLNNVELKSPRVTMRNLNDRLSVEIDPDIFDLEVMEIRKKFDYWKNSWNSRVNEFAIACTRFFSI